METDVSQEECLPSEAPPPFFFFKFDVFLDVCQVHLASLAQPFFYFTLGLKKTEQRFLSPQSHAKRLKSCVMVKRSLFDKSTLAQLDKGKDKDRKVGEF